MENRLETDILIIGGGINGVMIARELSKYKVDITLVEKEADVSFGISKGSNGQIYAGFEMLLSIALKRVSDSAGDEMEKTKEALCRRGYQLWQSMLSELDIPYKREGLLVIAANDDELGRLKTLYEQGKESYDVRMLGKEEILFMEPNVTGDAIAGIYEAGQMIVHNPFDATIALAENARNNGVRILLNTEVKAVKRSNGYHIVETSHGSIKAQFVINAAGRYVDSLAAMTGTCEFGFNFFKGYLLITDKNTGGVVNNLITAPPLPGITKVVQPTVNGNLRLGTIYEPTEDRFDLSTRRNGIEEVLARARSLVPSLTARDIITYFTGTRMFSKRSPAEYIIESQRENPRFISVGPGMPGFITAPAIAEIVIERLANEGLQLVRRGDFNPYRKNITRFSELSDSQKAEAIRREPGYSHVICRCEHITEAEIVESIRRGATTLDGIKFRTGAGMGRCQGGFCGPRVTRILARELGIPMTRVTKKGGASRILLYRTKELLDAQRTDNAYKKC